MSQTVRGIVVQPPQPGMMTRMFRFNPGIIRHHQAVHSFMSCVPSQWPQLSTRLTWRPQGFPMVCTAVCAVWVFGCVWGCHSQLWRFYITMSYRAQIIAREDSMVFCCFCRWTLERMAFRLWNCTGHIWQYSQNSKWPRNYEIFILFWHFFILLSKSLILEISLSISYFHY